MVAMLIQTAITAMWGAVLVLHTRRLLRLAQVNVESASWDQYLRQQMHRVWWWLGREEFWGKVQTDTWRCLETTLMIFLLAWAI